MSGLRIVGAGLGRTGTASLKRALEHLLGGPCYHMLEVMEHPRHVALWHAAVRGEQPDWAAILDGYVACVDWPACAFWEELANENPDAPVLLSTRESPEKWWASMERTIVPRLLSPVPEGEADLARHRAMVVDLLTVRFDPGWRDGETAKAAYTAHAERVRRTVPPGRLVEWQPQDGWEPLCAALGVSVPEIEFPHDNTTAEFRARAGLDE